VTHKIVTKDVLLLASLQLLPSSAFYATVFGISSGINAGYFLLLLAFLLLMVSMFSGILAISGVPTVAASPFLL
jgi:hypothetical protein